MIGQSSSIFFDRLAISVADATFWLLIIGGISASIWVLFTKVVSHLIEDITNSKKEDSGE